MAVSTLGQSGLRFQRVVQRSLLRAVAAAIATLVIAVCGCTPPCSDSDFEHWSCAVVNGQSGIKHCRPEQGWVVMMCQSGETCVAETTNSEVTVKCKVGGPDAVGGDANGSDVGK